MAMILALHNTPTDADAGPGTSGTRTAPEATPARTEARVGRTRIGLLSRDRRRCSWDSRAQQ